MTYNDVFKENAMIAADILEIQKRTHRIFSEMQQRSIKLSLLLHERKGMTMSDVQYELGYKFRSGAVNICARFVEEFPDKYEVVPNGNSTIIKVKDDFKRNHPEQILSLI